MPILIISWREADLLSASPYAHNQVLEGDDADALRIAGELFATGLNVSLCRAEDDSVIVAVDNLRFEQ